MEETGECRKCPGNLYKNVSIKLKNVKCITELDKSLECYELLGSQQKMVNACKMLATDVGAVKGKDKAEWTLYIVHTYQQAATAAREDALNACAIW